MLRYGVCVGEEGTRRVMGALRDEFLVLPIFFWLFLDFFFGRRRGRRERRRRKRKRRKKFGVISSFVSTKFSILKQRRAHVLFVKTMKKYQNFFLKQLS